ncbi:hypothetical protein CBS63078_569 [Aspergillus niger]|nr:hypothetical protein CBS115989_2204 [Aspergillus niger]KAI2831875.1 hypothetical protein CBS133816_2125 [Aspergillus niger]KAI2851872.1 hypothetical protein CBS11350_1079 [Aspergillus niger]KAI2856286.1 hypothetical protein CBS11232_3912 [Aspergillus niger]KAI2858215.1 hypothetical protein CBS12448_6203 [Aspergillus niger]
MNFTHILAVLATIGLASAAPANSDPSQCTTAQANSCCTSLTNGILNVNVLPALCVPLVGNCNNQAACCETNGILKPEREVYFRASTDHAPVAVHEDQPNRSSKQGALAIDPWRCRKMTL